MVQLLWKTFGQFLTRWNMQQYDPAVMFLGIYRTEMKTHVHTKTCIWMFIVILFIIAKHWKQLRCPSVGEWMNKLWYIQTMEYHSVLKRNELWNHEKTWRKFKCILLIWKGYMLYDSNSMTFWKRQSYGGNKKFSGCQEVGERINSQTTEDF